ncbi:von Willebrand factor D and EGF domain-containing protein-like isoform X2 [Mya arenaria]|uniref:von Willebrand factor D and EGF domain-containing protein-like isoform X2 n=1 Tax=Mya arenaria TaxID=6604 RepID=UPI0022E01EC8|nr:von Willebrand factor D and EGF domain-containing protein-like isoform X2 [Mya arenaria]
MKFASLVMASIIPTLLKGCRVEDGDQLYGFPMRKVDNIVHVGNLISDSLIPEKWYRTVYMGKQYLLLDINGAANWKLTYGMCGTYYPIYLQDAHPDIATLNSQSVEVTACTLNLNTECLPALTVYIRKCGEELQYLLTASTPYAGYCFDEGQTVYDPVNQPAPAIDDVDLGQISITTRVVHTSRPAGPFGLQYIPTTHFVCYFNMKLRYFYTVNWYIDGINLTTTGPSTDSMELSLTETTIMNTVRPGFTIKCGVQASVLKESKKTDEDLSEEFFAGVKIENRTIHLPKGGIGEIVLKTTIPVACQYLDGLPIHDQCKLTLEMGKKKIPECTGDVRSTTDCNNVLTSLNADGTFEPAEIRFPIVTVDIDYNDKSVFDIDLRFGSHTSALWHNYVLPSVRVIVEDTEEYKSKWCYSHIDPHMRTTDGRHYEQQSDAGVYMMYTNKAYDIEVQQKTKPCNNDHAMCACGVAVRAGKDVFMINRCGSIHYIDFVHCGEGGILEVLEINSKKYRVLTPIGTRIEIRLYGGSYEGTMNIDIYMAPKDFNSIEGLCGTFDNDVNNEFLGSNGQQLLNENDFAESWRMDSDTQNTGLKEKNLFINSDRSLQSWKERNHLYCFCQSGAANCSSTQYYKCSFPNSITPLKCHVSKGNRKKRGTDSHMKELRRLFDLMNSVDPPMHYLYKVGGTLVWANAHVESYNDLVKNMIDLQPEYAANNTERIDVFLANTCPSNCTGNGNCTLVNNSGEGVCVCDAFYHGAECSIDERDPLIIDDIETGGECDTAERSDNCRCFAIRSGAILRSIQCNVKTFKISINGEEELVSEYRSNGSYEDIFTGVCCSNHNKYDADAFAVKYEVSASNGGSNYGNIKSVFVFDSTCQNVAYDKNTNGTVFLNTTSGCFIENRCYSDGEVSPFNTCLRCNSSVSATDWSEAPCTTTTVSTTTTTNPTTTKKTTTTTAVPTKTNAGPMTSTVEPTTSTAEPTTTTAEHTTTTAKPTTTTKEPTTTSAEPTTTTSLPTTTTEEPTTTTEKPTITTVDPTMITAEPTTRTAKPTTTTAEPTTTTAEPSSTSTEDSLLRGLRLLQQLVQRLMVQRQLSHTTTTVQ